MQIRMDKRDAIPIGEWEGFLTTARRAGATDDAMVEDETYHADSAVVIAYKIDIERDEDSSGPESVTVPADILHDLLFITRQVASSDGDVRGLEEGARKTLDTFNDHFLAPVLGPDPRAAEE